MSPKAAKSLERLRGLVLAYLTAKEALHAAGYIQEIDFHEDQLRLPITETRFMREAAWVVLCSGMREAVISRCFARFSAAFFDWRSTALILTEQDRCTREALRVFRHQAKIKAIIRIAALLSQTGVEEIKARLVLEGAKALSHFPYLGPVTSIHLAKNLGLPLAKPDRHLVRIANRAGYESVQVLCEDISSATGQPIQIVDFVLWRFATIVPHYLDLFELEPSLVRA